MQAISAIAVSGMKSATSSLQSSAHNIANLQTAGFQRQMASNQAVEQGGVQTRVSQATEPGNSMETDMVGLLTAKNSFMANLAVFRRNDQMAGTMLNMFA